MTWPHAARLLRRTGFGATGRDVDALAALSTADAVERILAASPEDDAGVRATPPPDASELTVNVPANPTREERSDAAAASRQRRIVLTQWWIRRMVAVEEPFLEKLAFTWHNHFATSIEKVQSSRHMLRQNELLRTAGRGRFDLLARAVLTDPAMLLWLDGDQNVAGAPNENLAREFLELFTLGHDSGYSEADVRAGARALTGWRVDADTGAGVLVADRHDPGPVEFLGRTGSFGADEFCAAVLQHPAHPTFVATRLWGSLASGVAADAGTQQTLVEAYRADHDVRALMRSILTAPAFAQATGTVIASPVEWIIGLARALSVPIGEGDTDPNAGLILRSLRGLGQIPFNPPSVGGWPRGHAWLSSAAVGTRFTAATELAAAGDLSPVEDCGRRSRLDATAHLLGISAWSSRSRRALASLVDDPPTLIAAAVNSPEYLAH